MTESDAPPGPDTESPRGKRAIAVVLTGTAGFVDAAGVLALGLFTAHMSGNTARLGVYLGGGFSLRAAPSAFAIGVFVLGIAGGTATIELLARSGLRSPAGAVLAAEALLLVCLAAAGSAVEVRGAIPGHPAAEFYPLAALAVLAMGLQTSTLQRVSGKTVRTTYVSGMLTNLADEVVAQVLKPGRQEPSNASFLGDELGMRAGPAAMARIRLILGVWFAYVAGAVFGGYLERQIHLASLAVPAVALVGVIVADLAGARS